MNNLQIAVRYKIQPDKLQEFKQLVEACLAIVKEKDHDTLQFDWFFNEDQTECVLLEQYPDSTALMVHLGNIGDLFGKIMATGEFSAEIYGEPSEELMKATTGLNIKVYSFYQGMEALT